MKVEEKLQFFSKIAFKEAIDMKNRIAEEMDAEFNSAIEKATEQAEKQAAERIASETYKVDQVKNKEIIKATNESKKAWIDQKNELVNELFENIEKRLRAYTETESYKDSLFAQIESELGKAQNVRLILASADMKYADEIHHRLQVPVEESKEDLIGGFKLLLLDRNGFVDFSFGARLEEEKQNFILPGIRTHGGLHARG